MIVLILGYALTHCTKMDADKLAKNTPNAPNFICPNCLPKLSAQIVCPSPKVWDFNEKKLHWVSVVREPAKWTKMMSRNNRQ